MVRKGVPEIMKGKHRLPFVEHSLGIKITVSNVHAINKILFLMTNVKVVLLVRNLVRY